MRDGVNDNEDHIMIPVGLFVLAKRLRRGHARISLGHTDIGLVPTVDTLVACRFWQS